MSVFTQVRVLNKFLGNTVVKWDYSVATQGIVSNQTYLTLEWSRTGNDEWRTVEDAVRLDDVTMLDTRQRLFGKTRDLYYRLKLASGGKAYYSEAAQAGQDYSKETWLRFKEMHRLAVLTYRETPDKISACLLKKRRWGHRCSCVDTSSGYQVKDRCHVCFGTGIIGGYYPAIPVMVQEQPRARRAKWANQQMVFDYDTRREASMIAFPVAPQERDVLVNTSTDERYYIAGVAQSYVKQDVKLGNLTLIKTFDMDMAPVNDVVHEFPLDGCGVDGLGEAPKECPTPPAEEVPCGPESQEDLAPGEDVPLKPFPQGPGPAGGPGAIIWPD